MRLFKKPFPYTTDMAQIPTTKLRPLAPDGCAVYSGIKYACPEACFVAHLEAWIREVRAGNKAAPSPERCGHLMFEQPERYGYVQV